MKIAIFASMQFELSGLSRKIDSKIRTDYSTFSVTEGTVKNQKIILVKTGMGKEKAENATKFILNHYSPDIVFMVGIAGGVKKELKLGDIVVCQNIYSEGQKPLFSDSKFYSLVIQLLREKKIDFHGGNILTVSQVISQPEMKREIAKSFPVSVVEMESYWIASVLDKTPFLAIRVISDTVDEEIPNFHTWLFYLYEWKRIVKVLIGMHKSSKLLLSLLKRKEMMR